MEKQIKTFWDDFIGKQVTLIIQDYLTDKYTGQRQEIVRPREGYFLEHDWRISGGRCSHKDYVTQAMEYNSKKYM